MGKKFELSEQQCASLTKMLNRHLHLSEIQAASALIQHIQKVSSNTWLKKHGAVATALAKKLNKSLGTVEFKGDDILLETERCDPFMQSLLHIFRNAVVHGLETAEERQIAGKASAGKIVVIVKNNADTFTIQIGDNGKGIDTEQLRSRIIETGLITASQANKLREEQVLHYLFDMGFSTERNVSIDSGRGVGLPEVKNQLEKHPATTVVLHKGVLISTIVVFFLNNLHDLSQFKTLACYPIFGGLGILNNNIS